MAKGNLILGTLSGSIGDVTTWRAHGKQMSRVRVRNVANPKSTLQEIQRAVLRTTSRAYSAMQDLCNHSFLQGSAGLNQNRFNKINMDLLRKIAAEQIVGGAQTDVYGNFNQAGDMRLAAMPYYISEGPLPSLNVAKVYYDGEELSTHVGARLMSSLDATSATYDDVITALGAQRGDQLTAVIIYGDDWHGFGRFELGRVILTPANGNYDTLFLDDNHYVNQANPLNEDVMQFDFVQMEGGCYLVPIINDIQPILAGSLILSRRVTSGGQYKYSSQQLVITDDADIEVPISMAIVPVSSDVVVESAKYLDNAQNLGQGGQVIEPITPTSANLVAVYETMEGDVPAEYDGANYITSPTSFAVVLAEQAGSVIVDDSIVRQTTVKVVDGYRYNFTWSSGSDGHVGTVKFDDLSLSFMVGS